MKTIEERIIDAIKKYGLFLVRLNNNDWVVGKNLYHMKVTDDHYKDKDLCIASSLEELLTKISLRYGREE